MQITIRRPKLEEKAQIEQLLAITIRHTFQKENIHDPKGEDSQVEINTLEDSLKKDYASQGKEVYFLIALHQQQVVGTIAYGPANTIIQQHLKSPPLEVKAAYILPDFQNQGIGSKLYRAILQELQKQAVNSYCLDSGYPQAQSFWRKKLGEPSHLILNYWGEGIHHMIWQSELVSYKPHS